MPFSLTGEVIIRIAKVAIKDRAELEQALTCLMPVIADEILTSNSVAPATKQVALPSAKAPPGSAGDATVTTGSKNGSVSMSVSADRGGVSGGTVTGTWSF